MKKHFTTILLVAIFIIGLSILLYPTVADLWNASVQSRAVAGHMETVAALSKEDYTQALGEARAYNAWLAEQMYPLATVTEEDNDYHNMLNVGGNSVMGFIDIEKIQVQLPIYHGTSEGVLQIAIGHMVGSSLPVGGVGTHAALTGHTGLPSSKILTDLDRMRIGNRFDLHVLGDVLRYEVDQILTVEPHETEALMIDPEQDYVTLVTCTPYGINSHRLLVRGHRIAYEPDIPMEPVVENVRPVEAWKIAIGMAGIQLIWNLLSRWRRKRRELRAAKIDGGHN